MSDLTFNEWDSKAELLKYLEANKSTVFNLNVEGAREYYSADLDGCVVGLCSQALGIKPMGLNFSISPHTILGFNQSVGGVCRRSCQKTFEINLGSPFYEFIEINEEESVIVVHELGVLRISHKGKILWRMDTNVLESYNLESKERMRMTTMDGESFLISIRTGEKYFI